MTGESKYYIMQLGNNFTNNENDAWWLKQDCQSWIHQNNIVAGLPESEHPGKFTREQVQQFQKHQPASVGVPDEDDGEIIKSSQSQP